ncbi:MAG TPA: GNAT family N-acetyltransferase [Devosia sp.]|nr:GNAT family N-acetyltransferase [Devosia sp.]
MTLIPLQPAAYDKLTHLASAMAARHGSVAAVLDGAAEGEVWVDDADAPRVAILEGPEGTYLIGRCPSAGIAAAIGEQLDDWVYLYVDPTEQDGIAELLPNDAMLAHPRLTFTIAPTAAPVPVLPTGYRLIADDDGLGQRIYAGDVEVSRCLPDLVVGKRAEMGVWTHADHRRRGLARLAAQACLAAAHDQDITAMGWHCHASNRGSIELARQLGASGPVATLAYSASLPAENASDLPPAEWQRLARHFAAKRTDIAWLGFHAACAWAAAGADDEALAAVEQLVADGWTGSPAWLSGHWALARLAGHKRMQSAIETLKKSKAPPG